MSLLSADELSEEASDDELSDTDDPLMSVLLLSVQAVTHPATQTTARINESIFFISHFSPFCFPSVNVFL